MFGSSFSQFGCRRSHILSMLLVFVCVLTIWVTWQVSYKRQKLLTQHEHLSSLPYKRQELFTLREHLGLPRHLVGSVLLTFLVFCVVFLCSIIFDLCLVCPMLLVSLQCQFLIASSVVSNVYLIAITWSIPMLVDYICDTRSNFVVLLSCRHQLVMLECKNPAMRSLLINQKSHCGIL